MEMSNFVRTCTENLQESKKADKDTSVEKNSSKLLNSELIKPKRYNDSLCWHCTKACGEYSWSRNLTPVEGWNAEEIVRETNHNGLPSYKVISCPEYIEGR
jgi:hypothetical protein